MDSAAFHLEKLDLGNGWHVLAPIEPGADPSGGAFSVGYLARHSSGLMGFVKAFDYAAALEGEDPARQLQTLTELYNAERDLLELCGQRRLSRVVRALAAGTVRVEGFSPSAVSYLIFELAASDAREFVTRSDPADFLPTLRLMHNAAAAMSQLHSIQVAHQDVKPSNLLVFHANSGGKGKVGKLGDLGCAHMLGRPSPHDELLVAGDCSYAAPEQLYRGLELVRHDRRRYVADIYQLGNLFVYLLTGVTHNGLLYGTVDRTQHWSRWGGSFEDVLPGLIDTHGLVLSKIEPALHVDVREPFLRIIDELCYPDPRRRGDPVALSRGQNSADLHRYVSRLDLMHRRASLRNGLKV